jgi:hypothetical protein
MAVIAFLCPACRTELGIEPGTEEVMAACPSCAAPIEAYFLPAFFRPVEAGASATPLADAAESSCFYHPQKQAARVCDGCGRMICALCDVDLGSGHLCPACIASGRKKGQLTTLEGRRMRYDSIVMSLGIFSVIFYFAAIILAPAAIYLTIRHWNSPGSVLGRNRARFIVGCTLATLMLLVFFLGAHALIFPAHRHYTPPHPY